MFFAFLGGILMFINRSDKHNEKSEIKKYFKSNTFQRLLIAIVTILVVFVIVETGAAPKKYKLEEGQKSEYDIIAPRDIENKLKTEEKALEEANKLSPVMRNIDAAGIEVLNVANDFFDCIKLYSNELELQIKLAKPNMDEIKTDSDDFQKIYQNVEQKFTDEISKLNIKLNKSQILFLLFELDNDEFEEYKNITTKDILSNLMLQEITEKNIQNKYILAEEMYDSKEINDELKEIGRLTVRGILEPNRYIDNEETELQRNNMIEYVREKEKVMILKGDKILRTDDIVTKDKIEVLKELNLLETTGKFDYLFALGILITIILLSIILILYIRIFCKKIYYDRNYLILLSVVIILTILMERIFYGISSMAYLAIPVFIAPILITIFLNIRLAIVVNFVLALVLSLMIKEKIIFLYMLIIGGTLSTYFLSKANQRSKLSLTGFFIGIINVVVVICVGIINQSSARTMFEQSIYVFLNGILSIVLAIGMLPFLESAFNTVTPLKLLELADPNQPLIKRLLMEAPGTYHHSLMVGNLAEVATQAIGGNPLLARVGAYFHDIGKLKRPNFFKENQMADNPHDRMTPNLSTLVITSHTKDGEELAVKHKLPKEIIDIIIQHHGRTLVAYFFHKAKKGEKGDEVKEENFRYEGPRPSTKEAAVVMLADSVEAAVRSLEEKTEGKIEGLIRKIIKDKLDDGQLDNCDLTLKDLDDIAKSFLKVLSGFFHERTQYPDIKFKKKDSELIDKEQYNEIANRR